MYVSNVAIFRSSTSPPSRKVVAMFKRSIDERSRIYIHRSRYIHLYIQEKHLEYVCTSCVIFTIIYTHTCVYTHYTIYIGIQIPKLTQCNRNKIIFILLKGGAKYKRNQVGFAFRVLCKRIERGEINVSISITIDRHRLKYQSNTQMNNNKTKANIQLEATKKKEQQLLIVIVTPLILLLLLL